MNAAEKARLAKEKAEQEAQEKRQRVLDDKLTDAFYEAQNLHAQYLELQKSVWLASERKKALRGLQKAIRLYKKCAKSGHTDSMECLAFIYQDCLHDSKNAFKWYKTGAENGNKTCMHNLGVCYQDGTGVKTSYSKAQYWFKREEESK